MAGGRSPRAQAKRADRNDVFAVKRQKPVCGPNELRVIAVASTARVTHDLRRRKAFDRIL